MPPRTRRANPEATTAPTRILPQNADELVSLLVQHSGVNIITTDLPLPRTLLTSVRGPIQTARDALRFSISEYAESFGRNAIPDFALREKDATQDIGRIIAAIRAAQRRERFR